MGLRDDKFNEIRNYCIDHANPANIAKYSRYFTEGYDAYGLGRELEVQAKQWHKEWRNEMSLDDFFLLGERLIASGKYEEASCAVIFMEASAKKLSAEHFERLGAWLENGIANWAHTDTLCSHVLSRFILKNIKEPEDFKPWVSSPSKWKRRAVPVSLLAALNMDFEMDRLLAVVEPLMMDQDVFVQKGEGWFLREAWKKRPDPVEAFLMKWKDHCGRTIIQYAVEKMDKEARLKFKKAKPVKTV